MIRASWPIKQRIREETCTYVSSWLWQRQHNRAGQTGKHGGCFYKQCWVNWINIQKICILNFLLVINSNLLKSKTLKMINTSFREKHENIHVLGLNKDFFLKQDTQRPQKAKCVFMYKYIHIHAYKYIYTYKCIYVCVCSLCHITVKTR